MACVLNESLSSVSKAGPIWMATKMLAKALYDDFWESRYVLFWIALEALFGPGGTGRISDKVSQRLAVFLSDNKSDVKTIAADIREAYKYRCLVVHGRSTKESPPSDTEELLFRTETWLQSSLKKILQDVSTIHSFQCSNRDQYLDALKPGGLT
jgi:hypothetical protein